MKQCPKCKESLGDNVKICFNCQYNFVLQRVSRADEVKDERMRQEQEVNQMLEQKERLKKIKEEQILKNPMYEYALEIVNDNNDGTVNGYALNQMITQYAETGWRLHSISMNEVGKNASASLIGIFGISLNATIDQTVLIFERCIKL